MPIKIAIQFCVACPRGRIWSKGKDSLWIGFQTRNLVKRLYQVPKLKECYSWVGEKEVKKKRVLEFLRKGQDLGSHAGENKSHLSKRFLEGL